MLVYSEPWSEKEAAEVATMPLLKRAAIGIAETGLIGSAERASATPAVVAAFAAFRLTFCRAFADSATAADAGLCLVLVLVLAALRVVLP